MDPEAAKEAESDNLKRSSQDLDPEEPVNLKQTKPEVSAESSSDDDPFVPDLDCSGEEPDDPADSSSDEETQGFDLDDYLKYRQETQDSV